jgi:uncharacterized membrane protein
MDYLEIDSGTDVKQTANVHAVLNGGALALTAANLALRRDGYKHTGGSLALSAIAAVGVIVSGWFGGRMVYEQGMRVKGVNPIEDAPEVHVVPGDERLAHALHDAERYAPSAGPRLH